MKYIFLALLALFQCPAFAAEGGEKGGGAGQTVYVALDPLTINLRDEHFVQFRPVIKVHQAKDANYVQAYTPVIRFELIKSLIGKTADGIQTTAFISAFSKDAADLINEVLHDEYVKEVLFDSWLIQ